ncbi:MAG: pyrroloquinoline quinone biosynthesis protein PqqE [Pseudomonadota bacterium]
MNDATPVATLKAATAIPIPVAMLAELTHRCPLSCPYCSNPLELTRRSGELDTETWIRVFREAAVMGIFHVHLSGGEPAARRDLPELVAGAVEAGLYTNLITSGVGLTETAFAACAEKGLDHVQLSVQGVDAASADRIGGYKGGFETKMRVARWVTDEGIPLTVNAVMHRQNLDRLAETIQLAVDLGAHRLEVANTQYHGWASVNRAALMPTEAQARAASRIVAEARARLKGTMVIDYVPPDHHARFPKACMGGWARMGLCIKPEGKVLPCHAAESIPTLEFDNVADRALIDIWKNGEAFTAYRGTAWMPATCAACERREIDWGGCRCQAMAYAGDAAETDPVCEKSPAHGVLKAALAETEIVQDDFTPRRMGKRPTA